LFNQYVVVVPEDLEDHGGLSAILDGVL